MARITAPVAAVLQVALRDPAVIARYRGHIAARQVGQVVQRDHLALSGWEVAERLEQDDVAIAVVVECLLNQSRSETDQALCTPPSATGKVDRHRAQPGLRVVGAEQPSRMLQPAHKRPPGPRPRPPPHCQSGQ